MPECSSRWPAEHRGPLYYEESATFFPAADAVIGHEGAGLLVGDVDEILIVSVLPG